MRMLKSKLLEIKEREHLDKIEDIKGEQKEIGWGSQIRSYVFMPYTLVKDHRTGFENGNINAVMDGDLEGFINAYLKCSATGEWAKYIVFRSSLGARRGLCLSLFLERRSSMLHPSDRAGLKAHAKETLHAAIPGIYLISLLYLVMNAAPTVTLEPPTPLLTLATLLLNLFLFLVLCGYHLYALRAVRGEETGGVETLFACFRQLGRFAALYLLQTVLIALWSILFVIPGIIAAYAYRQAPYIMLDDPDITPFEALRASKKMMRGHKLECFILELSFLGWGILSVFTFGLLNIWVNPYQMLTYANYYNALSGWTPAVPEEPGEPEFTVEDWWKQ